MPTSSPSLIDAVRTTDRAAIGRVLSDDIAFHSPVADYRGRDEIVNLLATIGTGVKRMRTALGLETT
jgi:hypothetical protein